MKKVILVLSALFIGGAVADSAPTSVGYVDNAIGALQNKISAVDTNTVLTTTNTAGEIGQKSIYDTTGNYAEQTDALVTAEVANAAVQTAIDGEFVCTEWLDGAEHINENCLIYEIRAAKLALMPTGYTQLEYLGTNSSPDSAYIDTGEHFNSDYTYDINFAKTGSENIVLGVRNYEDYRQQGYFAITYYTKTAVYSSTETNSTHIDFNDAPNGTIHNVKYQQRTKTLLFDNRDYWRSDWITFVEIPHNVYLFAFNVAGNHPGGLRTNEVRIYHYSVQDSNGLFVQNLIPARRDSDGEIGMYDLVSNTFFTNAGTGEFIAGPELNIYLPSGI